MTIESILLCLALGGLLWVALYFHRMGWRKGVVDGYAVSKDASHPRCQKARMYLTMAPAARKRAEKYFKGQRITWFEHEGNDVGALVEGSVYDC